jgi:putative ABC transport system permease protein
MAALTSLIFGLAPALQFSKPNLGNALKEAGQRVTGGAVRLRLRNALVIAEVALALVLLVGAGLLVRSFLGLVKVDPGFAADKVIALQVFIWDRYPTPEQRAAYTEEALKQINRVPGVEAVGATTALPFFESSIDSSYPFTIQGRPAPPLGQEPTAFYTIATADYFSSVGVRLLKGREFNSFDKAGSPAVALINETMARRFWRDEDPVGRKFDVSSTGRSSRGPTTFEIVGVVSDVRHDGLDKEPRAEFYRPYAQSPSGAIIFAVRTSQEPTTLIPLLKSRLWEINSTQPFYTVATAGNLISESLQARRFSLLLLVSFAALALVLTIVGVYGVMSYLVSQRTHEIGVRLALGARTGDVLKLILRQGLAVTAIGICVGLFGAFLLTRLMGTLLYGVGATDPLTFILVPLILAGVALLACYVPARRATKVDPMVALRYE